MAISSRSRLRLLAPEPADLRACPACSGLIEAGMRVCPTCGRWLGSGTIMLWRLLVIAGSLLILLTFFCPWLALAEPAPGYQLSGYDLADMAHRIALGGGPRPTYAASLALYLVPASALVILGLIGLCTLLGLGWAATGRLLVALAAIPLEISLLVAFFTLGSLTGSQLTGIPQLGLAGALLGSIIIIISGIALGGPSRPQRRRRHGA